MDRRAFVRATLAGTAALALRPVPRRARWPSAAAEPTSASPGCATSRATGTWTSACPPTCSTRWWSTPRCRSTRGSGWWLSDRARCFDSAFCLPGRAPAGAVLRPGARLFERYLRNGGFVFVDDCNHDIDGLFATLVRGRDAPDLRRRRAAQDPAVRTRSTAPSSRFPDGPPATGIELNGWGDDLVHDYLKGIELDGRLALLYSNKDYGCEWDYDFRNKRFLAEDNTKFAINIVLYATDGLMAPVTERARSPSCLARVGALRAEIGEGDRRPGGGGRPAAHGAPRRRPLPARGRAGPRQDADGPDAGRARCTSPSAAIQFTPDLMPTDIVGTELLEEDHGTGRRVFRFSARARSSRKVRAGRRDQPHAAEDPGRAARGDAGALGHLRRHDLPRSSARSSCSPPRTRSSRRAPIRCRRRSSTASCFHVRIDYPREAEEASILRHTTGAASASATAVLGADELTWLQQLTREVHASEDDAGLHRPAGPGHAAGRRGGAPRPRVGRWGAGPRAGQALVLGAKARALLEGRFAITPDDVRALAAPVLRHRVLVNFRAEAEGMTADSIVARLLAEVPGPRSPLD